MDVLNGTSRNGGANSLTACTAPDGSSRSTSVIWPEMSTLTVGRVRDVMLSVLSHSDAKRTQKLRERDDPGEIRQTGAVDISELNALRRIIFHATE
uniref:Uncharacterized protein n=1 Tax=Anopheles minimus TaxID=112268 RepID=A0A182VY69_9DIPT